MKYLKFFLHTDASKSGRQGAWYLLPDKSSGKVEPLTEKDTVILYLHGNCHNRAQVSLNTLKFEEENICLLYILCLRFVRGFLKFIFVSLEAKGAAS